MWAYATFFKHKIGFYKVSRTVWVRQMYSLLLNVFVLSHEWGVIFLYTNFILLEQAGSEVAEMCLLHLVTHLKKKKKKKSDSWMGTDAALWESNWFRWVLWVKKKKDFSRPKLCECLQNKTLNLYLDRAIAERLKCCSREKFQLSGFLPSRSQKWFRTTWSSLYTPASTVSLWMYLLSIPRCSRRISVRMLVQ